MGQWIVWWVKWHGQARDQETSAICRSTEIYKERRSELNLLLLRQGYLNNKLQKGNMEKLAELKAVELLIIQWCDKSCDKVKHQRRSEYTTMYWQEKDSLSRSSPD